MTLNKTQRRNLNRVFRAMNPDDIIGDQLLTNQERIEMYRQSAHDDHGREMLEENFLFIWRKRGCRMANYKLSPGDAADLLGHFRRE